MVGVFIPDYPCPAQPGMAAADTACVCEGGWFDHLLFSIPNFKRIPKCCVRHYPSLTRWPASCQGQQYPYGEGTEHLNHQKTPKCYRQGGYFLGTWAILLFIRKPANKAPGPSTYTVLDVEVGAIRNQGMDHLVPIQPHGIMQGSISLPREQRLIVGLRPGSGSRRMPSRAGDPNKRVKV